MRRSTKEEVAAFAGPTQRRIENDAVQVHEVGISDNEEDTQGNLHPFFTEHCVISVGHRV